MRMECFTKSLDKPFRTTFLNNEKTIFKYLQNFYVIKSQIKNYYFPKTKELV